MNCDLVRRSRICPLAGMAPNTVAAIVCLEEEKGGPRERLGNQRRRGGGDEEICTI
jgi:hypothetical protein